MKPTSPLVLGISGSPHPDSNTDRLVRRVLEASGLPHEFVKLSQLDVRPCRACLGCVKTNQCVQPDDFAQLAPKVRQAKALVMGSYPPYGSVDAFSKAFLERLYSLRHVRGFNRGKLAVVLTVGNGRGIVGVEEANQQVAHALSREGMEIVGRITATGNPNCMVCGFGEECELSAVPKIFPDDPCITRYKFARVEDQPEVWQEAARLGRELARRLGGE